MEPTLFSSLVELAFKQIFHVMTFDISANVVRMKFVLEATPQKQTGGSNMAHFKVPTSSDVVFSDWLVSFVYCALQLIVFVRRLLFHRYFTFFPSLQMMDGNKDEADRCLEYAEKFILEGKNDKAEKFLQKAERLFPSERAKGKKVHAPFPVGPSLFSLTIMFLIVEYIVVSLSLLLGA